MKTFLLSVLSCAVLVGPVFASKNPDDDKHKNKNREQSASRPVNAAPRVNAPPRNVQQAPRVQRNVNATPQFQNRVRQNPTRTYTPNVPARTYVPNNPKVNLPDQDAPRPPVTAKTDVNGQNANWRTRRPMPSETSNPTVQPNTNVRNRDWQNRSANNRNWRNNNNTSGTFTYEQARRHHDRQHHHRNWWRSHYSRIALFGGGYYYWNNNYWYPAYGYDPYYRTYAYDEPIYGYNNLEPGQVIANVQSALQEQGYYRDAVDGLIGPATRAALANFQQDQGLPITSAIDGPTLQALGLY